MSEKKTVNIPASELVPIMEQQLKAGRKVSFSPKGVSMRPLLREGKDSVTLAPFSGEIKSYDIALYQRENGAYVLHRAIIKKNTLLFIGDNQFIYERGINRLQIKAVVCAVNRNGKEIGVENLIYKGYCRIWQFTRPLRYFVYRVFRKVRSIINGK